MRPWPVDPGGTVSKVSLRNNCLDSCVVGIYETQRRDVLRHEERAVTIDMIQKFVADYYQLKMSELKSKNDG